MVKTATAPPKQQRDFFMFEGNNTDPSCIIKAIIYYRYHFFKQRRVPRKRCRRMMTAYLEKNQTKLNLPRDTKLVIMFVKADIDKNTIAAEIVINKYEIHTDRKEEISEKTKKVLIHCFKVTSAIVSVETADGTKVFC